MFGWYILVLHVTFGGSCGYNAGMAKVKLYCAPTQVVQDGGKGEDCQERKGASMGMRPEGHLLPASHLDAGPAARVRRDDDGEVGEVVGVGELDLRDGATVQVRDVCRATGASRWRGGTAKGQERECGWDEKDSLRGLKGCRRLSSHLSGCGSPPVSASYRLFWRLSRSVHPSHRSPAASTPHPRSPLRRLLPRPTRRSLHCCPQRQPTTTMPTTTTSSSPPLLLPPLLLPWLPSSASSGSWLLLPCSKALLRRRTAGPSSLLLPHSSHQLDSPCISLCSLSHFVRCIASTGKILRSILLRFVVACGEGAPRPTASVELGLLPYTSPTSARRVKLRAAAVIGVLATLLTANNPSDTSS